ncbi:MAG: HlyD family type I secretion periplasmic adaptor subunit [Alphaproteobacteria bacterium]
MSEETAPTSPATLRTVGKKPSALNFMSRSDQEFLPSALEILERPPSPIALALLVSICAIVVITLTWSWFGYTDIVAIAQGKIQPSGRVKTVQPIESGKIEKIRAVNGQKVAEGDTLIELQSDDAQAEGRAIDVALWAAGAENIWRLAVVEAAKSNDDRAKVIWPVFIPLEVQTREELVAKADLTQLRAQISSLDAQRDQKKAERERLTNTIGAQEALITILSERVDMRQALQNSASGTRASLIDAQETLAYQKTFLATERGQLIEAERGIDALTAEINRTLQNFIAENILKASDAKRVADEARPRREKVQVRIDNLTLRAPVSGVVQASSAVNSGQVLIAGQEVMRVVPDGLTLEAEAYLPNKDIGFVHEGQHASIKIEAFPFTRYGTIEATVLRVGQDAIPLPEAIASESSPGQSANPKGPITAQRVQNLYYPVVLKLERSAITSGDKDIALSPGMAVTAEIKTGERRLLDYFLSPLIEVSSLAIKER